MDESIHLLLIRSIRSVNQSIAVVVEFGAYLLESIRD